MRHPTTLPCKVWSSNLDTPINGVLRDLRICVQLCPCSADAELGYQSR